MNASSLRRLFVSAVAVPALIAAIAGCENNGGIPNYSGTPGGANPGKATPTPSPSPTATPSPTPSPTPTPP